MLSAIVLGIVILSGECCYGECHCAGYSDSECCYTECPCAVSLCWVLLS
jgi:hypothetical protein